MSTNPIHAKLPKKKTAKPTHHVYKTSFTVEGPVTVKAAFGTYSIGQGDSATFKTDKGKKIIVRRHANVVTVVTPKDMTQSFVVDTNGPNSSAVIDIGGGFGGFASINRGGGGGS
jgi:hypothetical protein